MHRLASVEAEVGNAQQTFAEKLQAILDGLAGRKFSSFAEKQDTARRIQAVLSSINHRIQCTRCGEPAAIRVARSITEETGVFQFGHTKPKSSTHQGCVDFPVLKVVTAPEDRRLKKNKLKIEGGNTDAIVNDKRILDTNWMGE